MNRRTLLLGSVAASLAACANGALTPALVVSDAQAITNGLATALPQIAAVPAVASNPTALATITKAEGYVKQAQAALAGLSANLPAQQGATILATVEGYLNAALDAATAIQGLPPNVQTIIDAVAAILPVVEAFVNTTLGTIVPAAARPVKMTPDQARAVLAGLKR